MKDHLGVWLRAEDGGGLLMEGREEHDERRREALTLRRLLGKDGLQLPVRRLIVLPLLPKNDGII